MHPPHGMSAKRREGVRPQMRRLDNEGQLESRPGRPPPFGARGTNRGHSERPDGAPVGIIRTNIVTPPPIVTEAIVEPTIHPERVDHKPENDMDGAVEIRPIGCVTQHHDSPSCIIDGVPMLPSGGSVQAVLEDPDTVDQ
jgi:hypothetical protein